METEENTNCENFYWYKNTEIDDLLKQTDDLGGTDIKKEKVIEIQDILARDAVVLPLYSRLFALAHNNSLRQVNLEILEEKPFLNIATWKLSPGLEIPEGEKTEIIIGYESDQIDIINGFEKYFINDLIFSGLWKDNPDGTYEIALLEDYIDSKEEYFDQSGLTIEVTLKDGILWQDSEPITSYDVQYTLEYFLSFMEENEYFSKIDEDYKKIKGISVIDDKKFIITFNETINEWQKFFKQIYKNGSFDFYMPDSIPYEKIISNGPYKIEKYEEEGRLILEINENYHGELPEIERLIIQFDPDINNLIAMLKEDEIDALSIPVDPGLMAELDQNKDIELLVKPGNLIEHLALSLKPSE